MTLARTWTLVALALLSAPSLSACLTDHPSRPQLTRWDTLRDDRSLPPDPWSNAKKKRVQEHATAVPQGGAKTAKLAPQSAGELGRKLDRALTHFVAGRAGKKIRSAPMPTPSVLALWNEAVEQIDQALDQQPLPSDLGALVRARVTLEVEMDRDQQRFRAIPESLSIAYVQTLEKIDKRVRALHASQDDYGFGGKIPRQVKALVLDWPLRALHPSSPFGYRRDPFNGRYKFHSGIDLAAPLKTTVYAAAPGVVVFAGKNGGWGNYVVIEHPNGIRTHYAHLDHFFVSAGTVLDSRSPIGGVGSTGRSTGPHLHFGISIRGRYVDPTLFTRVAIDPEGNIGDSI